MTSLENASRSASRSTNCLLAGRDRPTNERSLNALLPYGVMTSGTMISSKRGRASRRCSGRVSAFVGTALLATMTETLASDEWLEEAERACTIIHDYAVLASRKKHWPPTEHAERRLPLLYDRCARHEDACLATREELEDRGWDDGQLECSSEKPD